MPTLSEQSPLIFDLLNHPLSDSICQQLPAIKGEFDARQFPDGESYLQIMSSVAGKDCIVLVELSDPDPKFLPLCFLVSTLKELGASSVGLIAPYLSYMRQDRRFLDGEAITSRIFSGLISGLVDWLVTVDPHLHRYRSLDEIYSIPNHVVQGAQALATWLQNEEKVFLVGPDSESEQWVSSIAAICKHPYIIGEKTRSGDRDVNVNLPDVSQFDDYTAIIIDDVISSGQTILECMNSLRVAGIKKINCASVHGIFADDADLLLLDSGIESLVTTNTIPHASNHIDVGYLLVQPIKELVARTSGRSVI